jgi:DNA-binding PadR family transcriptional regulator
MRGRHKGRHGGGWFGWGEHREGGGPWGSRSKFFESGEVRIALLSLLEDGAKHGYELMKELEARSGGTYKASAGTVYPNLQMLEDEGLIRAEEHDGKRVFALTDAGRAELDQNRETIGRIWNRADDWGDWSDAMSAGGMEVWGPALRLARAAFKAAAGGDEAKIEKVRKVLSNAVTLFSGFYYNIQRYVFKPSFYLFIHL